MQRNISRDHQNVIEDLKKDESTVMTVDKANATVVRDKDDYYNKTYELLDNNGYTNLIKDYISGTFSNDKTAPSYSLFIKYISLYKLIRPRSVMTFVVH